MALRREVVTKRSSWLRIVVVCSLLVAGHVTAFVAGSSRASFERCALDKNDRDAAPRRVFFQRSNLVGVPATLDDVEGCFAEWSERFSGDANLRVRLAVTPDGNAHATATGTDSAALRLCVSEAFERVRFSFGPDRSHELSIRWVAGRLSLAFVPFTP